MTEGKKDREIALELETQTKEVRHQLSEQLRCLNQRLECHGGMTIELMDFYQRLADIEQEYSKNLERLVRQIRVHHKSEKQKRETWSSYSTYKLWQSLLDSTAMQSKNHAVLSETYGSVSVKCFGQIMEDLQRIYNKCKEIALSMHKEVFKVLDELQGSMKTYHQYHEENLQLANKLQRAETQKVRVEKESKRSSGNLSKRVQSYEKQTEKRRAKLVSSDQKVMKARNDYLLGIKTTNSCIHKFFMNDLPELMNAMDYGYHTSMSQLMATNVQLERNVCNRQLDRLGLIEGNVHDLSQSVDRQAFIQASHPVFSLPKKYNFQAHKDDSVSELVAQRPVKRDLSERMKVILERIEEVKLQNDELWKTLETTEAAINEKKMLKDFDMEFLFKENRSLGRTPPDPEKQRIERTETQMFYLSKLKDFLINNNMVARLEARYNTIEKALENSKSTVPRTSTAIPKVIRQKQYGKGTLKGRPKLFGGSIEEYVEATGQEIPLVIRCCINIINLHGMHHRGLFRVPGSQNEIQEFKNIFEKGEEVILKTVEKTVETRVINAIASVLKLYLRELSEPLFPVQLIDELTSCVVPDQNDPDAETVQASINRIQELLLPLPRPMVIVMRYLFAFLNHVTEHSDENAMDARNLAICFGPTLLPMPPEQVNYQGKLNDLVQFLIVHHERIFPFDGGLIYEKCLPEPETGDFEETLDYALDSMQDLTGKESEDADLTNLEAVALYDFESRTGRELSFKKGDTLVLKRRISEDWWEGILGSQEGLVPNNFFATNRTDGRGVRLRTSSESLPNKPSEITCDLPPTAESFDRSKSESNICDDLVSDSAAVAQSSSSTTSDLSRCDGSLATWSGKSSSSKDMLDEPVLFTDSEAASPVGFGTTVDAKQVESKLSAESEKNFPASGGLCSVEIIPPKSFDSLQLAVDTGPVSGIAEEVVTLAADSGSDSQTLQSRSSSNLCATGDDVIAVFSEDVDLGDAEEIELYISEPKPSEVNLEEPLSVRTDLVDTASDETHKISRSVAENEGTVLGNENINIAVMHGDLADSKADDLVIDQGTAHVLFTTADYQSATVDPPVLDQCAAVNPEELFAATIAEIDEAIGNLASKSAAQVSVEKHLVAQSSETAELPCDSVSTRGGILSHPVVQFPQATVTAPPLVEGASAVHVEEPREEVPPRQPSESHTVPPSHLRAPSPSTPSRSDESHPVSSVSESRMLESCSSIESVPQTEGGVPMPTLVIDERPLEAKPPKSQIDPNTSADANISSKRNRPTDKPKPKPPPPPAKKSPRPKETGSQ